MAKNKKIEEGNTREIEIRETLKEFVDDIDITGGVFEDRRGFLGPAIAVDWTDLGATYMKACKALGRKPKIERCQRGGPAD